MKLKKKAVKKNLKKIKELRKQRFNAKYSPFNGITEGAYAIY